jgi:SAM-dependent methyltransferase
MGEIKRVWAVGPQNDIFDQLLFYRCLKAYDFAKPLVAGKRVLEIGCGTCYGLDYFNQSFAHYVGMDIDVNLLSALAEDYLNSVSPVSFLAADINHTPLQEHSFDLIISFQVIEHIPDAVGFLRQAARLLKPGGQCLVTTPNRAIRLLPFQKPWNPEHVQEYSYHEFHRLLSQAFDEVRMYSVCGDDISFDLESRRVKQDPYQIYVRRPLGAMARRVLPASLQNFIRQHRTTPTIVRPNVEEVNRPAGVELSLGNFFIREGHAPHCIDFLAVMTG